MADTKISDLNALTYLTGTYLVPAVDIPDDANGTKKVTLSNFWLATDGIIPSCRVYHDANQSIANITDTVLSFNSERWDTDVIHDTVTNNSRLTCKTAGKYFIFGTVRYESNNTGARGLSIFLNGATDRIAIVRLYAAQNQISGVVCSTVYDLAVNDYVQLYAFQGSGGALNCDAVTYYSPEFGMIRIGD